MLKPIDFHTHAYLLGEERLKEVMKEVTPFLCGHDGKDNKKAMELGEKLGLPYFIGISPQRAPYATQEEILFVEQHISKAAGIGEIGMDFKWEPEKKEEQLSIFDKMLDIAEKSRKPIVLHTRAAEDFVVDYLVERDFQLPAVFHFFSGKKETALKAIKHLNAYISIVPFPSKNRKATIKAVGLERLVVETDAPYAGKTPLDVKDSISYISRVLSLSFEKVTEQTTLNALAVIGK